MLSPPARAGFFKGNEMLKIKRVDKRSAGKRLGAKKGWSLAAFDGREVVDILDYEYYDSQESFSVDFETPEGRKRFEVDKSADESMGFEFEEDCYLSKPRPCRNNCIFCFVAQLPKGMRRTLYVKDDDWRLSFVSGTYVTLTNLAEGELERIKEKKFSPIYVSVHATDDDVRRVMLGNPSAPSIMPMLETLAEGGIVMHTQIVVCAGYNDGEVLKRTLKELYSLYPMVASVAIVPVGLTSHRQTLTPLSPLSPTEAGAVIDISEGFNSEVSRCFALCSDEMYLRAERALPPYEFYGDFDQIENGVGLMAKFRREFEEGLELASKVRKGSFTVVSGVDAAPFMRRLIDSAAAKFPSLDAEVVALKNRFFGETVTVSGLLTGGDIADALENRDNKKTVLLPRNSLKEFESVFLDGMTVKELKKRLNRKIRTAGDGYELAKILFDGDFQ